MVVGAVSDREDPTWESAITCADASDLLEKFRQYLKARGEAS